MANVYPFRAVQYGAVAEHSQLIAPPYDVLDLKGKERLLERDPKNIVAIDLPHVPAKELGPSETYQAAGEQYRRWLEDGTLEARHTPAMFAYRQTFEFDVAGTKRTVQRCGMGVTTDAVAFGPRAGGGVLPHEETFSGPKEDRFALMKATRAQLSPVFGLHADESGAATGIVRDIMARRAADRIATTPMDNVLHEIWTVDDDATIAAYQEALAGEDIFIADGHHRYGTGLNYIKHLESLGNVPPEHPARRSMMVLVGMSDQGLVIGPTHRVLGGMRDYTLEALAREASSKLLLEPITGDAYVLERALHEKGSTGENRLGLYDFASKQGFVVRPAGADPLATRFPSKPREWRTLDVAIIQHLIVEEICQPRLNGGQSVRWAFPHTVSEVLEIGAGHETGAGGGKGFVAQMALIVRPTPLSAVKAVSRANELMPQKSTFFYPKLATGLFVNSLE